MCVRFIARRDKERVSVCHAELFKHCSVHRQSLTNSDPLVVDRPAHVSDAFVPPPPGGACTAVPVVDVSALFQPGSTERCATDAAILRAAGDVGFLTIVGLPASVPLGRGPRANLLRIFQLDESVLHSLWRRKFEPRNPNLYRGWFPVQPGSEDPGVWVSHANKRHCVIGAPHTDSGFMTLLAQDGVPGVQARSRDDRWVDVAPQECALAVNFGQVLERWSAGRVKATEHRILGTERERYSIPFFLEARADAEISPLPMDDPASFEPFLFWRLPLGADYELRGVSGHGSATQAPTQHDTARARKLVMLDRKRNRRAAHFNTPRPVCYGLRTV